ncbi:TIGR02466 family protein [Sphingomonas humi]|uniref:Fe2OG dioxygenase domain-containing protein n=1 Tax=Sphingomonas humi TaxID=335630 RepID=A0ABP7S150_9SPHN
MTLKLLRIEPLFQSPLAVFEVEDSGPLNARLLEEIGVRRAGEPSLKRSNRLGWHSEPDFFRRPEPAHRELAGQLKEMVAAATRRIAPDASFDHLEFICDGWINVNPASAYNTPHDHVGALWSGCYYVAVPAAGADNPDGGAIEFLSPNPSSPFAGLLSSAMTVDKVKVQPSAGKALLFPGALRHWVHPQGSGEDRVTIAFNAVLRKRA